MGYLPDAFHVHFRDESGEDTFRGMRLRYAVEDEPLGTAGAIRFAAPAGINERFVVCNGDVLTGLDLSAMVEFHDERGAEVTIALTRVEDPSAFGVVPTALRRQRDRVRREARAGKRAERLDQRGHVRARAVVPRPDPARA